MNYIIGIDSGGTKTEAIVYDLAGNEYQRIITGFGNMLIDREQGLANIKLAIKKILAERNPDNCQLLVLGLAGIDSGGLREVVTEGLAIFHVPIVLLNDAQLAHYALLQGEEGVLVIAGTGSVCFGRSQNEWYRVGGWGHLFGDEGSGYYIGKLAIQHALAEFDLDQEPGILTQRLYTHFEVTTVLELIKVAYQLTKDQVAEIAQLVADLAEVDPAATTILLESGKSLAKEVEKTVDKMRLNDQEVTIGLNGSVIENNQLVRQAFFDYLKQCSFEANIIEKIESSAKGAYYFYKKNGENL